MDSKERAELRELLAVADLLQAGGPGVPTVLRVLDALDAETARADALERRVADVEEDATRLKETGHPAAPPTWRTMETAPLDGTPVLVHTGPRGFRNGAPYIEVMRFHGFLAIPSALPRLADWRWMPIPEGGL